MQHTDFISLVVYFALLIAVTPVLGSFMYRVYAGQKTFLDRPFGWLERLTYRAAGVDPSQDMSWRIYAKAMMWFNLIGIAVVFLLQILQKSLPLNPQGLDNVSWHSALNTAVSFVTNTNWQGYAGETTMSYLTQMAGLGVQNFVSAATGMAVAVALARGIARRSSQGIGNFWSDMVRGTVYILLPLSVVLAIVLVGEGVVQTFSPYATATTLEGAQQTIPLGPAASQIAIKQIGTNGGGFFNANSAVPFENPTPFSNFLEVFAILALAAGFTSLYGRLVGSQRHGWVIFGAMFALFVSFTALSLASEYSTNPVFGISGVMEGKEVRFGVMDSVLWSTATTAASNGSVNSMHSSLTPLAGGIAMLNIMLGEVVFGGVGAGLYGVLAFVLMTVFLAGLMVGRTPEYLGKKVEAREITMVIVAIVAPSACILIGAGLSAVLPVGLSSLANAGPHGLSEVLYAFASAAGNNGSAFAGLNANTPYYNVMLAIAMFIGRFAVILPMLAVAGYMGAKKFSPPSPGTFEVDTPLFGALLVGVILIVGGLTFFPALSLGPIVEHFLMLRGQVF